MSGKGKGKGKATKTQKSSPKTPKGKSQEFYVEKILDKRTIGRENGDGDTIVQYLVKWWYYPTKEATWEPLEHLTHCQALITKFNQNQLELENARENSEKTCNKPSEFIPPPSPEEEPNEAESVDGIDERDGQIKYLIKWKNSSKFDLVPSEICAKRFPQVVIKFWESHLKFD